METQQVIVALEGLAQESRLGIFRLLVETGPLGLAAGEIARRMELPAATLSFHLTQLKHAGLIAGRREGTSLIYSANFEAMNELIGFLTDNCCGGRPHCGPAVQCKPGAKRKSR